ncbi:type I glyceraldehyde-3-phosphate dehydrogenase [Cryobacterium sp. TMT2-4]|uniref:type I glyceraldehyde-3-phosphate dehydrogenase n=2 Tax=Cryobacterium TaxID=69578 RepID=UPI0018E06FFA|nr:glyceraldehyde 3-phosphate dehydrogenase NAD-binding domain-containing protein [Cryobacterium sp. TMT2-4]
MTKAVGEAQHEIGIYFFVQNLRRENDWKSGGSQMPKVAINGLGRIGRAALKILLDSENLELVAVNDVASIENLAYLLRYDTVYGRYHRQIVVEADALVIDGHRVVVLAERDPAALPWRELGVDLVLECTGAFTRAEDLTKHIQAGASFVILSAPTKSESVPTVVHGVNRPDGHPQIISCASCTTNCITPVIEIATRRLGVERAIMTTIHAYTATQRLVDSPSDNFRRGRAGGANLVPAPTGAAQATIRALPELTGLFAGVAIRAPIEVGSIADIVIVTSRPTSVEEVNAVFIEEAKTPRYQGILGVSADPMVSSDIIGDSRAAVVNLDLTQVVDGTLIKIMAWYDNEWGFTHQMIREARATLGLPSSGETSP